MIFFDPICIGTRLYQLQEITFNGALKVSVIPKQLNEKRLSEFLRNSLLNGPDPLQITVVERYALLVSYLYKQTNTLLKTDIELKNYLPKLDQQFQTEITENGLMVRLLTGFEAEYLESQCKSVAEWIACSMALQMHYEKHDVLSGVLELNSINFESQFIERLNFLKNLPQSEFEQYYDTYSRLNDQLMTVLDLAINDDGFVVNGGTEDAPVRFCPSAAFLGLIKEVDELHYGNNVHA